MGFLLASSTALVAMAMDSQVTQIENQVQQVCTNIPYGAQTASAQAEGYGWFFNFEALYWHAKVGGTEFAHIDETSYVEEARLTLKGCEKGIDFKWDCGIRVGLKYNFEHNGWGFKGQYTWFDTSGSHSVASKFSGLIIPTKASIYISSTREGHSESLLLACTSAKSEYNFGYKAIDLELDRVCFIDRESSLRPHWGLKVVWIDQAQIIQYTGGHRIGANIVRTEDDCKFWGLGPCLGLDYKWHLGYGFSISSDIAGTLFLGFFNVNHEESYTAIKNNQIAISFNSQALSPTVQMKLVLCYDKYIHNNTQHIGAGVGFEAQYWCEQKQMLEMAAIFNETKYRKQSVSMYGLGLDIHWNF
ncbi:MAG: Lpg1974 family pore-forming outer membrane protein [Simkaniaceae bacterium]|nr:Lpg1974 family pore-forming outer membrane protein [Simkaniaceae bacterium]